MVGKSLKQAHSTSERQLLHALALMADQYLGEDHEGERVLDHMWMSAGEAAFDQLAAYGLIEVSGRGAVWTAEGRSFLERSE